MPIIQRNVNSVGDLSSRAPYMNNVMLINNCLGTMPLKLLFFIVYNVFSIFPIVFQCYPFKSLYFAQKRAYIRKVIAFMHIHIHNNVINKKTAHRDHFSKRYGQCYEWGNSGKVSFADQNKCFFALNT